MTNASESARTPDAYAMRALAGFSGNFFRFAADRSRLFLGKLSRLVV